MEEEKDLGNEEVKKEAQEQESKYESQPKRSDEYEYDQQYNQEESQNEDNTSENKEDQNEEEDDFDFGDEYDEERLAREKQMQKGEDEEYNQIKNELKSLNQELKNNQRFPRVESKPEFASGILNSETVKRVGNLNDEDIYDLLNKRKFYNFLKFIGWNEVANDRVFPLIQDIEDYSLSRKGRLLDSVFIDRAKQESLSYEKNPPKGGKIKDVN